MIGSRLTSCSVVILAEMVEVLWLDQVIQNCGIGAEDSANVMAF